MMEVALEEWSKAIDPQGKQIIVLILDQAGWHTSKKLRVPSNVFLLPLPAYTPELSPAEPMVTKLKIPLANKLIETIQEVEDYIHEEGLRLKKCTQEVKSLTLFPWINMFWNHFNSVCEPVWKVLD
ncbi:transposase [Deinococcus sp.]|uniref:transposase n=1 Tax=Deinococcus sp. TaxID=47478 RepID=UPI003B5B6FC3